MYIVRYSKSKPFRSGRIVRLYEQSKNFKTRVMVSASGFSATSDPRALGMLRLLSFLYVLEVFCDYVVD